MKFLENELFIIAEAGVNHNGSPKLAHEMIDIASNARVNAIKFQTFDAEKVCIQSAPKAVYQAKHVKSKSQIEMLKELELSKNTFRDLASHAKNNGIEFMSTAFDKDSLDFLIDEIGMRIIKVPSGEIDNYEFLSYIATKSKPTIISTGASCLEEIKAAFNLISQNNIILDKNKTYNKLKNRKIVSNNKLALLHCISEYPASLSEANINCIKSLSDQFECPIGYSDHCKGIAASLSAASIGASIIEKHFTLDKNLSGPDHKASIDGDELKNMVSLIKEIKVSLGSSQKNIVNCEIQNQKIIRRSIVALKNIKKGDKFSLSNLTCKRPANGLSASKFFEVIGKKSMKDYQPDEPIEI